MKTEIMFMGERIHFGKIVQFFKDAKSIPHHFSGIKNIWFGSVYEMNDDKIKVNPTAIETDWVPTDEERDEYEAQKLVVRAHRQARKKAMDIKKPHEKIVRAVELIRPFYLSLHNIDRRRFMEWFANECSRKGKK